MRGIANDHRFILVETTSYPNILEATHLYLFVRRACFILIRIYDN